MIASGACGLGKDVEHRPILRGVTEKPKKAYDVPVNTTWSNTAGNTVCYSATNLGV